VASFTEMPPLCEEITPHATGVNGQTMDRAFDAYYLWRRHKRWLAIVKDWVTWRKQLRFVHTLMFMVLLVREFCVVNVSMYKKSSWRPSHNVC